MDHIGIRVATSLIELAVGVVLFVWIGWPGVVAYIVGAVVVGLGRDWLARAKIRKMLAF
jgi:hypothetical protein